MFQNYIFNKLLETVRSDKNGSINNRPHDLIMYDENIISSTPEMTGKNNMKALHEIHIFMSPLWIINSMNIDDEIIEKYKNVVKKFNEVMCDTYPNFKIMKDPVLALKFEKEGYIVVIQSSLYILSNSKIEVIKIAHDLAELFKCVGFNVIREKIEASVYGIDGIPQASEEMIKYNKYFEFHIRVQKKNENNHTPLTDEELESLENVSKKFREKFNTPVPLSYNKSKNGSEGGYQRYLNVRFRNIGAPEALTKVNEISSSIITDTPFRVIKIISEYVWYDTFVDLDKGWIDF